MTKFDSAKMEKPVVALVVVFYVAIQSFAVTAPFFSADDMNELFHVRTFVGDAWWRWFGPDAFELFRPVKNLMFLLFDWMLPWGGVMSCRMAAIAIGIASFVPVLCLCRLVATSGVALFLAAVWFLSPTLVSSAAWLSCVNIQIMVAFAAGAMILHDRGRYVCSAICLAVALLSYESAVAVGPVVVAFDFFLRPSRFHSRRGWWSYALYAGVTLIYLVIRGAVGSAGGVHGSFAGAGRLDIVFASAYFTCLHLLAWVWPFGRMALFGSYVPGDVSPMVLISCWLFLLAMAVFALLTRRRRPLAAFGLVFFIVAFLPTSNILGFGNGPYGDYYLGYASLGLAFFVVDMALWMMATTGVWRIAAIATIIMAILWRVAAGFEAMRWARLWSDAGLAAESGLGTFPKSFSNRQFLAKLACDAGHYEEALSICRELEEMLPAGSDQLAGVYITRAVAMLNWKNDAESVFSSLERMLSVSGGRFDRFYYHHYRGCAYDDLLGDALSAEKEYVAALELGENLDVAATYDRLARLKALRGDLAPAIALWRRAIQLDPYNVAAILNLSTALRESGDSAGADGLRIRAMSLIDGHEQ